MALEKASLARRENHPVAGHRATSEFCGERLITFSTRPHYDGKPQNPSTEKRKMLNLFSVMVCNAV
jgi:hypothetical protein